MSMQSAKKVNLIDLNTIIQFNESGNCLISLRFWQANLYNNDKEVK